MALRESVADLDPPLSERISEMGSAPPSTIRTIIEAGSRSASAELALAIDIMEELALQMVEQFFISMKSCIELVLSRRSSFEFAETLLENHMKIFVILEDRIKLRHIWH